jgi:hypothetical protein
MCAYAFSDVGTNLGSRNTCVRSQILYKRHILMLQHVLPNCLTKCTATPCCTDPIQARVAVSPL